MTSLSLRLGLLFAALASALALGAALTAQYAFGYKPCELCLWQRYPYAAVTLLAGGAFLAAREPRVQRLTLLVSALLFFLDAAIAAYHTGVEQGWLGALTTCAKLPGAAGASLDELRASLLNAPLVSCSQPSFVWLGLSMAAWNILAALALGSTVLYLWKRTEPKR